jgi:hypothetical protein
MNEHRPTEDSVTDSLDAQYNTKFPAGQGSMQIHVST